MLDCTPESVQAYHGAIELDRAAIAAMTTIPDVEAYVLTTIAARAALELKTAADDRLVKAKENDSAFLSATYATRAAAEAAIRALAVYGTLNDADITWAGITATIALNTGTATFAFTDITSSGFVEVSFTAEQVGGAVGTADSAGIKITFDQPVTGLTAGKISVVSLSGAAIKGALTGSGTTWTIAISVAAAGSVVVTVGDFRDFTVIPVPQVVTLYKAAGAVPQALVLPFSATDAAQSAIRITLNNAAVRFGWDASEGLSAVTHGAQTMTVVGSSFSVNGEMTGYSRLTLFLGEKLTSLTENDYTVTLSADAFVGGTVPASADVSVLPLIALTPPEVALTPNTVSGGLTVTITDTANPADAVLRYVIMLDSEDYSDTYMCLIRRAQAGAVTTYQIPLTNGIQAGKSYYVRSIFMEPTAEMDDVYVSMDFKVAYHPVIAAPSADPRENYAFVLAIGWVGGIASAQAQAKLLFPSGRIEIIKVSAFYDNLDTPVELIPDAINWSPTGAAACVYQQFVNYAYSSSDRGYTLYQLPADELIPAADLQATAGVQAYRTGDTQFGNTPVDGSTVFLYEVADHFAPVEYEAYLGTLNAPGAQLRGSMPVVGGVKSAGGTATFLFAQVDIPDRRGSYLYVEDAHYTIDADGYYHLPNVYLNGVKQDVKFAVAFGTLIRDGGLKAGSMYKIKAVDANDAVTAIQMGLGNAPTDYLISPETIKAVSGGNVTLGMSGNYTVDKDTRVFIIGADKILVEGTIDDIQVTGSAGTYGNYRARALDVAGGYIQTLYLVCISPPVTPRENYAFVLDIGWVGGLLGSAQAKLLFPNGRTEVVKVSAFYDNSATSAEQIPEEQTWIATGAAACVYRQFVNYAYSSSDGTYTLYQLPADELILPAELQATAGEFAYTLGDAKFGNTPVNNATMFLYETLDGGSLEYKVYADINPAPSAQLRGTAPVVGGVKNAQGEAILVFAQVEVLDRGGDYVYFEDVSYTKNAEDIYSFLYAYINGNSIELKMDPASAALVIADGPGCLYKVGSVDAGGVITALESVGGVPVNYLDMLENISDVGEGTVTLGTTGECTYGLGTRVFIIDGNGELIIVTPFMIQPTDETDQDGTYRAYVSSIIYGGYLREIYLVYQPYVAPEP